MANQMNHQDTDQILDLFNLGDAGPNLITDKPQGGIEGREEDMVDVETGDVRAPGKKGWMDELGELYSAREYEDSFDLDGFLKTMG